MTPTQRSIKWLKDRGFHYGSTQQFVKTARGGGFRKDLYGAMDGMGVLHWEGQRRGAAGCIIGLQFCSASTYAEHEEKILKLIRTPEHPMHSWVHWADMLILAWRYGGPRGERKKWICNSYLYSLPEDEFIRIEM
jgi:hypothetical protein